MANDPTVTAARARLDAAIAAHKAARQSGPFHPMIKVRFQLALAEGEKEQKPRHL